MPLMPIRSDSPTLSSIAVGSRIRVKQRVTVGSQSWALEATGVVREVKPVLTGIHTNRVRSDDLWVQSVVIEKADGELSRLTFDENTQVELLNS